MMKLKNYLSIATLMFILCGINLYAQKQIVCRSCNGTGKYYTIAGASNCFSCWGRGMVVDPQSALETAAENGAREGASIRLLVEGNKAVKNKEYDKAVDLYNESLENRINISALIGLSWICYNVYDNEEIGNKYFLLAKKMCRTSFDDTELIEQINELNGGTAPTISNSNQSTLNSNNSSTSGRQCPSCLGNGQCTMCKGKGGYWTQSGTYVGKDIRTWHKCSSCYGDLKCRTCYGKGKIN